MAVIGPDDSANAAIPRGEFLLALIWFQRRESRRDGRPILRRLIEVIDGPCAGRRFFDVLSLDLTRRGTRQRWAIWLEQVNGPQIDTTDDDQIREHLLGRAFKAEVRVETLPGSGAEVNDITRLIYPRHYTDEDRAAIERWESAWRTRGWAHRDPFERARDSQGEEEGPLVDPSWSDPSWAEGEDPTP